MDYASANNESYTLAELYSQQVSSVKAQLTTNLISFASHSNSDMAPRFCRSVPLQAHIQCLRTIDNAVTTAYELINKFRMRNSKNGK